VRRSGIAAETFSPDGRQGGRLRRLSQSLLWMGFSYLEDRLPISEKK
jgi:hypothetical protein